MSTEERGRALNLGTKIERDTRQTERRRMRTEEGSGAYEGYEFSEQSGKGERSKNRGGNMNWGSSVMRVMPPSEGRL